MKPHVFKALDQLSQDATALSALVASGIGDGSISTMELNQAIQDILDSVGAIDGIAPLDASGKLASALLPAIQELIVHGNDWHSVDYVTQTQIDSAISTYEERTDNPNNVTKTQVGLGNVNNVKQEPHQHLGLNAETVASPPTDYPIGITHFLGDNNSGFPFTYTGVLTYNLNDNQSCYQIAFDYNNNRTARMKVRSSTLNNSTWGEWQDFGFMANILESPEFTGTPTAPTASSGTNTTQLATTAFVEAVKVVINAAIDLKANISSPTFTGTPTAPTQTPGNNSTRLATTAFVEAVKVALNASIALKANISSPQFTGTPTALTAASGTNTTQLATTAFVKDSVGVHETNHLEIITSATQPSNPHTNMYWNKIIED